MSEGYAKHSKSEGKKSGPVRKAAKFTGAVLLIVFMLFAGLLAFLSVTEYKPADSEEIAVEGEASEELAPVRSSALCHGTSDTELLVTMLTSSWMEAKV